MKPIQTFFRAMSDAENEKMLQCVLELLENPGMKIEAAGLRTVLADVGAKVNESARVVQFPRKMIEEVLAQAVAEEKARFEQCKGDTFEAEGALTFSWHAGFMTTSPRMDVPLGGGCPLYYDYKSNSTRYGNENDLIKMLHLAEGIEQIVRCGSPVHCISYKDGKEVRPEMMPLATAATVAKHSSKPGVTYLASPWQLDYSVAMGEVIKGPVEYKARPIFINNNDTVPPLELSKPEGEVVEALAKRALPVFVLVMPLMGVAGPVTVFSNAVIAIAEILGVWAAVKAVNPEVPLECSVVSGCMDPQTGNVCFSAPETTAIDVSAAQFFRSRGLRCGTGVGLIDAPAPGVASVFERTLNTVLAAMCGESSYPVGIMGGGNIFSPEQLMLDMDIAASHHHFLNVFDSEDLNTAVGLIREQGIRGFFMDTDHTVSNFRQRIWVPQIFSRIKTKDPTEMIDPVARAYERWNEIVEQTEPYHLPDDKAKEIDKILASASNSLKSKA